jgi:plasmid stabilization system protein ParE
VSRLRVSAAAEEELRAAVAWYDEQRPGLGEEFLVEVGRVLTLILQHPAIGSPVPRVRAERGTRRVPLRRFPYFVIYRERDNELHVIAFAHARRRPGYWRHHS